MPPNVHASVNGRKFKDLHYLRTSKPWQIGARPRSERSTPYVYTARPERQWYCELTARLSSGTQRQIKSK